MKRFKPYYEVMRNRMTYDPVNDKVYVTYSSQSDTVDIFRDEYEAFIFTWPELEKVFMNQKPGNMSDYNILPKGTDMLRDGSPREKYIYTRQGSEQVILVSDGDEFRPALTSDFYRGIIVEEYSLDAEEGVLNIKLKNTYKTEVKPLICAAVKNGRRLISVNAEQSTVIAPENEAWYTLPLDHVSTGTAELYIWKDEGIQEPYTGKIILTQGE